MFIIKFPQNRVALIEKPSCQLWIQYSYKQSVLKQDIESVFGVVFAYSYFSIIRYAKWGRLLKWHVILLCTHN